MEQNFSPAPSSSPVETIDEWKENYLEMRRVFIVILTSLLILSGGSVYFFYYQMNLIKKELALSGPLIDQMVQNYERIEDPQIKNFLNSLVSYSRTHPDFIPILSKYNISTTGTNPPIPLVPPIKTK
ncbi:MAG: hypothetical protein ABJC04_00405 [Verrucomicrobiota bacterium]